MSALTNELGASLVAYERGINWIGSAGPVFSASATMDASGEKIAFVGSVWHPTAKTGTINIRKVHFRCGAVTLDAGSTFTVSLQNVSPTAGPPYQPDGADDQTANMTLTANAWNTTGNLSADRAVDLSADSIGDANSRWVAVVFSNSFTAGDSVVITTMTDGGQVPWGLGSIALLNTGSWASLTNRLSNVALECDDGSYAFLSGCPAWSATGNVSVASNGAIRRAGLIFQVPTQRKVDRIGIQMAIPNGADGRLVLYDSDGTTELRSVDVDNDAVISTAGYVYECVFEPVTLAANTDYRFVFVSGVTTSATVYYLDVNAAGIMDGAILGQNARWTQHDGANWAETTTRRPGISIGFSAFHDGAGGAGGLLTHPGMSGGMRG